MTFEKIQAIIVDQLDKEVEEVQLATNFREDLDADSLDLFQIINDIEDEFDIKIESDEGINTVEELVQRNEEEMMKVRNLGRKSLEEVQQKLVGLGLSLRHNED